MTFSFLHAADLHLDSPLRGLDPEAPTDRIRGATRKALINLVELAKAEQVSFVLLAGDLYDGDWKDWRTGHFLVSRLAELKRAGIPVIAISGNHDAEAVLTQKLPFPGTMLPAQRPGTTIPIPGVAVHGQSFATRAVRDRLALAYPRPLADHFNIGLLHTACGSTEHDDYAPCTEAELREKGYDYWALGHVHQRAELSRDPWIVFPGNLQGRHIREEGSKGASLVRVADNRVQSVTHHGLDVLRWRQLQVDITGAADLQAVLGRAALLLDAAVMEAEGRLLVVRMTLAGASNAHAELASNPQRTLATIRAAATDVAAPDALWIEDVRVRSTPPQDQATLRPQSGVVGTLVDALAETPTLDPDLAAFIADLAKRMDLTLLDKDHPIRALAAGNMPDALTARAQALLRAELLRG
ncbi:DNA repair exonuclease [Acidisphaera sp. L21]|uniref:metallophosphoesterase family protein n=1 Tax=Acidisphaera sp. L21 TaxID=1641851 RepID=UPI00131B08CD|nr:DNA repair exonuclease [Acidisphaera sp. L21]